MPERPDPVSKLLCLPHDAIRHYRDLPYLGAPVDVDLALAAADGVLVRVRHVVAHPGGFSFALQIWLSEPDLDLPECAETLDFNPRRNGGRTPENLYVAVELPDGTSITSAYNGQSGDQPVLWLIYEGGEPPHYEFELVAPIALPEQGAVTIVFDWAARGIVNARGSIDAAALTEAARAARPLFVVAD